MSRLDAVRDRLRSWFRRDARDRELGEEIRYHLEMETQRQLARGYDAQAARAVALSRFGNPARVAQATRDERGTHPLEGIMQDFAWTLRTLRKHSSFTVLALLTLALGIGATTVAFTVLDTVLLRPLPFRESERLVLIQEVNDQQAALAASYLNFVDWREQARSFQGVGSIMFPWSVTASAGADPVRVPMAGVSTGFFAMLGVKPAVGREFTADENTLGGPPVVMVTHEFWRTVMGGRLPLGAVRIGHDVEQVVGVLPPGYRLLVDAQVFWPHERGPGTIRNNHNYLVVARLAPGASVESARHEMTDLSRKLRATFGDEEAAIDARITPLREYLVGDYRMLLFVVLGAGSLVLLIACTNLVSSQLARGLQREREIAVRAALGASRARVVRQLFIESGILTASGTMLGIVLAALLTRLVRVLGAGLVPRLDELSLDVRILLFAAGLMVITALIVGVYPALRLSGSAPGDTRRGAARSAVAATRSRAWPLLVGFEIATAVVLLVGCTLLVRTLHNILSADVGFDPHGVITAALTPDSFDLRQVDRVGAELAALPGVEGAAFTSRLPLSWGSTAGPVLRPEDTPPHWPAMAGFRVVSPRYFSVLRQPLLRGRAFVDADREGSPGVAIITQGIADKLWPGDDAVGKTIRTNYLSDQWLTVVGVVKEASSWTMPRGSQNEIYTPIAQHPDQATMQLVAMIRTRGDPTAQIAAVRARLHALLPAVPVRFGTIDGLINRSAADRRFAMVALIVFGAVALVLAGVGIYGVMSYSVVARRHEIGVRMALGATPRNVQAGVLGRASAMALSGVAAGVVFGTLATRYLESVLYGVSRLDPAAYAIGVGFLFATALLGAFVPARRSSQVDPVRVIRGD